MSDEVLGWCSLASEEPVAVNYFEVTYTCLIPTTCRCDCVETRRRLEKSPYEWISYLEKVESKFVSSE